MQLTLEDTKRIGWQAFPNELGMTNIVVKASDAGLSFLLLREALRPAGYEIVDEHDYEDGEDILLETNLSWELYQDL